MSRPKTAFIKRGPLIEWLTKSAGFSEREVEKWIREGLIQPHRFPCLGNKQPKRRTYCVATVAKALGLTTETDS